CFRSQFSVGNWLGGNGRFRASLSSVRLWSFSSFRLFTACFCCTAFTHLWRFRSWDCFLRHFGLRDRTFGEPTKSRPEADRRAVLESPSRLSAQDPKQIAVIIGP